MDDPDKRELHPVLKERSSWVRVRERSAIMWGVIKSPDTTNVIMALATVVIALFTWMTYTIVKSGPEDTKKIIQAAQIQAGAANQISDAADDFTDSARWMEQHMEDAANAMQDSVDTADANTKTTIKNAQNAFRSEQRAWVGVLDATPIEFSEAKGFSATVIFFNSGRTPARNVQSSGMYMFSPAPVSGPPPEFIKTLSFRPAQSIAPQGRYNLALGQESVGEITTPTQLQGQQNLISRYQDIKNKKVVLYFYGILKYDDVFGNHRETQYCISLADPDTKRIGFCDAFNDLN